MRDLRYEIRHARSAKLLIDLHTHTSLHSDDSVIIPDDLVEAARGRGLDGVCITEHDYFWDLQDILELGRRHDFLVLPGCEVNTNGGHVLVYGLTAYSFGMHRVEFLRERVEEAGGAMVAAHPYRRRYTDGPASQRGLYQVMLAKACHDPHFSFCDAIETCNGRSTPGESGFAEELGQRLHLAGVAGSDAHRVEDVGCVATEFPRRVGSLEDLIREIKAGRFEPMTVGDEKTVEPRR